MNILQQFPEPDDLIKRYNAKGRQEIYEVNGHVHTPYSFSAFSDIADIFRMAKNEHVKAIGINDFFVAGGYDEFYREALNAKVFPLFGIEFIGLMKEEQAKGIRINDPGNPGRCYFSGKGLNYPFYLQHNLRTKLDEVITESQVQIQKMVEKTNLWFAEAGVEIQLDFNTIKKNLAKELVRERHLAKAIRIAVLNKTGSANESRELFIKIYGGKEPKAEMTDIPGMENEIRSNLLKAGGKAFVEEDEKAFMSIDQVIEMIVAAGGIPCYPLLLDDKNGTYTDFEKDLESLHKELQKRNIACIELIPGRNSAEHLADCVHYFNSKGFIITFGTEHNAPEMIPLTCDTRGKKPLSDELRRISYEGVCVIAAHQYLQAKRIQGYLNEQGVPETSQKDYFIQLGSAVINHFLGI